MAKANHADDIARYYSDKPLSKAIQVPRDKDPYKVKMKSELESSYKCDHYS